MGASLSLDQALEQLDLRAGGEPLLRGALESRALPAGVSVVAAVLPALLVAAATLGWAPFPIAAPAGLGAMAPLLGLLPAGLLARAAFLFPSAPRAGILVATLGAALVLRGAWRALDRDGVERAMVFVGEAPGPVALVVLGVGGVVPAVGAMAALALGACVLRLAVATPGATDPVPVEPAMVRAIARAGDSVATLDEWVLGAIANAVGAAARIAAWVVARADDHVLTTPADRLATRIEGGARVLRAHGASPARIAWGLVALVAVAALTRALLGGS